LGQAFLVRGSTKYFSLPGGGTPPFALWLSPAILTYAVCGLLAGVISAVVWFHTTGRGQNDPTSNPSADA